MGLLNAPKFEDVEDATYSKTQPASQVTKAIQGNKMATNTPSTKVVTGVIRGSYCKLFKAELPKNAKEGDTPKFGMTILIPKDDKATLAKIEAARETAINLKFPGKRPAKIDTTLHDGDLPRPSNGEEFGEECKGHWVMAVASKFKPKILDRDSNEIIDPAECGSGDYFKVSLNAYGYDFSGKRGVSFGLGNVLFWDRGQSLGGTSRAEDDFSDDLPKAD
jgi:hypothetical protein